MADTYNEKIQKNLHKVLAINHLSESTFVLRFERKNLPFKPGQHIGVGPENSTYTREYSVYSGVDDDYLEILVKEVLNGFISPILKNLKPGDFIQVEEPRGYFSLPTGWTPEERFLFIATGTGIAPFHSFVKSNTGLNYTLFHGISTTSETCQPNFYPPERLILCTSRENQPSIFQGRVTDLLKTYSLGEISRIYLCGNVNMINDVYDILGKGIFPIDKIHSEVYF